MPSYLIRRATIDEAPAVYELVQRAYGPWVEVMGRRPQPMDEDYTVLLAEIEGWLALEGDELRGASILAQKEDHLWVDNVAVDPAFKGLGIGKALLSLAVSRASDLELSEVRFFTHELMAENRDIYARLEWIEYEEDEPLADFFVYFRKPVSA